MMRAAFLLVLSATLLGGCGMRPLYGGGGNGAIGQTLAATEVAPIEGQQGWLVANALRDRLRASGEATPRYRLQIALDDQIIGLGARLNDTITRERRILRARYQLIDLATGGVLIDATAGSDAGIDVVGSEYATIAAEQSALERLSGIVADQIVSRVALYAKRVEDAE